MKLIPLILTISIYQSISRHKLKRTTLQHPIHKPLLNKPIHKPLLNKSNPKITPPRKLQSKPIIHKPQHNTPNPTNKIHSKQNTSQVFQYTLFTNLSQYQKFRKYNSKEKFKKYLKKTIFKVGYQALLSDDNAGISDCQVLIKPLDKSTAVDAKGESENPYICEITHVVNYEKCPRLFALSLMVIQCDGKGGCYIATANKYEAPDANEAERRRLIKYLQP